MDGWMKEDFGEGIVFWESKSAVKLECFSNNVQQVY